MKDDEVRKVGDPQPPIHGRDVMCGADVVEPSSRELEQDLVPEWRAKYLYYKVRIRKQSISAVLDIANQFCLLQAGKKKLKAIARALRSAEESPWPAAARRNRGNDPSTADEHPQGYPSLRRLSTSGHDRAASTVENGSPESNATGAPAVPGRSDQRKSPLLQNHQQPPPRERSPLKSPGLLGPDQGEGYGSITTTSPNPDVVGPPVSSALELPAPAVDTNYESGSGPAQADRSGVSEQSDSRNGPLKPPTRAGHRSPSLRGILPGPKNVFQPRGDSYHNRPLGTRYPSMRRMFSYRGDHEQHNNPTEPLEEVRLAETDFFSFLDRELGKIEFFYKMKEEEASDRLSSLRSQLHLMRDTRMEELMSKRASRDTNKKFEIASATEGIANPEMWKNPLRNIRSRPASSGSQVKGSDEAQAYPGTTMGNGRADYVRRQTHPHVPYRSAKRKLKLALLEFYRGLELLKAYADLNRKAFRKMNKKYDKIANARPTGRYMSEKVNKAWFVQSDVIENHLVAVEDLYTQYIERGNRKTALGKLRGKPIRIQDYSSSAFRNGLMLAVGLVLGIQGVVNGVKLLNSEDDIIRIRTSYLFQVCSQFFLDEPTSCEADFSLTRYTEATR